ncbi:hypothetical protein [Collinsella sp. AK_207A]|nr:hypothetical protein [Collinsella sp. AK_207A]
MDQAIIDNKSRILKDELEVGEGDVKGLDDFELICFLVVRPQC